MKIAILTNFMEFNPGYSLTGIVKDQCEMFLRHGHRVTLFVNEQFNKNTDLGVPGLKDIRYSIPFAHLIDYTTLKSLTPDHEKTATQTEKLICVDLAKYDVVITHDFVFTGWFMPYGLGCLNAAKRMPTVLFLHWVHSVPSAMRDWWDVKTYSPNNKLVFPNETDRLRVAEQFRGTISDVCVIPHIKDPRSWFNFGEGSRAILDKMPAMLGATVTQVLPAGTDRLHAKGVEAVIRIFGKLKECGVSVCLLIANQWATGRQRKQCLDPYIVLARSSGLGEKEFMFTSDLGPDFSNGLNHQTLRDLMMLTNIFIFPTREESFGLVVPELALSSGALLVLNSSLTMQFEVIGGPGNALFFNFGSCHHDFTANDYDRYYLDIARIILGRLKESAPLRAKTHCRLMYNYDALYNKAYLPTLKNLLHEIRSKVESEEQGQP